MTNAHGDQDPEIADFRCPKCPALFIIESSRQTHIQSHDIKEVKSEVTDLKTIIGEGNVCFLCDKEYAGLGCPNSRSNIMQTNLLVIWLLNRTSFSQSDRIRAKNFKPTQRKNYV